MALRIFDSAVWGGLPGTNVDAGSWAQMLEAGPVNRAANGIAWTVMPGVAHNANNLGIRFRAGSAKGEAMADCGLRGAEIVPGKAGVHDGYVLTSVVVLIVEGSPCQQRYLQSGKVLGSDRRLFDMHIFIFARIVAGDRDAAILAVIGDIGIVGSRRKRELPAARQGLQNAFVKWIDLVGGISSKTGIDSEADQMIGAKPTSTERKLWSVRTKSPAPTSSSKLKPICAPTEIVENAAPLPLRWLSALQGVNQVGMEEAQSGGQAEQDADHERHGKVERQKSEGRAGWRRELRCRGR